MAEKDKKKQVSESFDSSTGMEGMMKGFKNAKEMLTGMFGGGEASASEKLGTDKKKKKD